MDCRKDSWLPGVAVEGPEGSWLADGEAAASFLSLQMCGWPRVPKEEGGEHRFSRGKEGEDTL